MLKSFFEFLLHEDLKNIMSRAETNTMMKRNLISKAIFFAFVLSLGTAAVAQIKTGGYKTAKTDDARVVAAANFAVEKRVETNTEQEGLTLDSIDKAETQVVAGTNFKLCLTVSIDDESQQVETVVYQDLKQNYSLKSWTVKECAEKESNASKRENPARIQNASFVPASQTKTPNCTGDQLALSETEGEADIGGKQYARFLLTNVSEFACALTGYPMVNLLNAKGQPLQRVKVNYNDWRFNGGEVPDSPPTAMLEPGKTAWFQIFYTDGMIVASLKKPASASAKIKVKAPKTNKDFVIQSAIHAYREIDVSYVREGVPD